MITNINVMWIVRNGFKMFNINLRFLFLYMASLKVGIYPLCYFFWPLICFADDMKLFLKINYVNDICIIFKMILMISSLDPKLFYQKM